MRRHRYLPTGALALSAAVAVVCALGVGCGPIEYLNQVGSKAANAVAAAKRAQADRYAPFEYTAAQEYLHKAREEAGYSQYQDSIEYGRKAEDLANRARAIAVARLSQAVPAPAAPAAAAPPDQDKGETDKGETDKGEAATPAAATPADGPVHGIDKEEPDAAARKPPPPRPRRKRSEAE